MLLNDFKHVINYAMRKYRYPIIFFILFLVIIVLASIDPIPQDLAYHDFADQRNILAIPNFWNVMSNLPMLFIGLWGIRQSLITWNNRPDTVSKLLPLILCLGIFSACFGSAYYHWNPNNETLVWDRLPMTFMFMPLFALLIYDFIGRKAGQISFYFLIPLGVFSVFYWQFTESIGQGDLRVYAFVQFFPMLFVPFAIWLFPRKRSYMKYIYYIIGWYIVAKSSEHFDNAIFEVGKLWSGHTLKHLFASIALIYIVNLILAWEKEL